MKEGGGEVVEKFYDESERVNVRFVGFMTDDSRYDFGIVYTHMFFGKPLVICMQTGRSTLLDAKDLEDLEHLQKLFRIPSKTQASELAQSLKDTFPFIPFETQYE